MSKVVFELDEIIKNPLLFNSVYVQNRVKEMIEQDLLSNTIDVGMTYKNTKGSFKTPFVDVNTKSFTLNDLYLDFLWIFIYSSIVAYEEIILSEGHSVGGFSFDENIYNRAMRNISLLKELRNGSAQWPVGCPSPKEKKCNTLFEIDRVDVANQVFKYSLNIILHHELAHCMFNHKDFRGSKYLYIEVEKEADNWALEETWDDIFLTDQIKRVQYLFATIFSFTSFLMACVNPKDLSQDVHLDIDARLQHVKDFISSKMDDMKEWEYFYGLLSFIIRTYVTNVLQPPKPMYAEDLANFYINQVEMIKQYYSH